MFFFLVTQLHTTRNKVQSGEGQKEKRKIYTKLQAFHLDWVYIVGLFHLCRDMSFFLSILLKLLGGVFLVSSSRAFHDLIVLGINESFKI